MRERHDRACRAARTRDERGMTLVLVAAALAALLAALALAVDLAMLFTARSEAQRAADAAALAGASAFLEMSPSAATGPARERALAYARRNTVRNVPIDSSEVFVTVEPEQRRVRVGIRRQGIGTWFAAIFGRRQMAVSAWAAAVASEAGAAKCLKPFALPDAWYDADDDTNRNRVQDGRENWEFEPQRGDRYKPYSGQDDPDATGYGSGWRNLRNDYRNDYGRPIVMKASDPSQAIKPGIFYPWEIPADPTMAQECEIKGGDNTPGAAAYRANICNCNNSEVVLGQEYNIKTGDMIGPTKQGVRELVEKDPDAVWDETCQCVVRSRYGANWMDSPRVVKVALWDPAEVAKSGKQAIRFNNFALVFLEKQQSGKDDVTGRFLYYVAGTGTPGRVQGSLVRVLRLVE